MPQPGKRPGQGEGLDPAVPDVDDAAMRRYLFTAMGVVALLYLAPFFLGRLRLWDRWNPDFFARPLNYAFSTAGENADVVLFGDSTAVLGVDPSQITRALGVKALNLVNIRPSLMVNDDLSLRRYLGANRPPRLIVFYFAPWDFDYGHDDPGAQPAFEGEELLLRRGTGRDILAFLRRYPMEGVLFPLRFYASAATSVLHPIPHPNQEAQLAATRGHVDDQDTTVLSRPCTFPQALIDRVRFDWVRSLGQKYASPQTRVLFYVAPVPSCGNAAALLSLPYSQLPAAPPRLLPPEFFSSNIPRAHPRAIAVPEATRNLIDAVRPLLGDGAPAGVATPAVNPPVGPAPKR
jgi:hypothetical protein